MVLTQMILSIFPRVNKQLEGYENRLRESGGPLARQGLDSIRDKRFHCLGGGVYALLAPRRCRSAVLAFIVAYQTISDYLDNLCDRFGVRDEGAFRQLHLAMLDGLDPGVEEIHDYYRFFPRGDDGGYLEWLVDQCRRALAELPHYAGCRECCRRFARVYIDLQSYKHLEGKTGEEKLAAVHADSSQTQLYWWEYAAACGSTLGIFALVAGSSPGPTWRAYMPWLNGLHIMLDYLIDQDEDQENGDMNLVSYYRPGQRNERILFFYRQARQEAEALPRKAFHVLVADGLVALYLSDNKAASMADCRRQILAGTDPRVRLLSRLAKPLRKRGVI